MIGKQSVALSLTNDLSLMLIICVSDDLSEYMNEDYLLKTVGKLQTNLCTHIHS